MFNHVVMSKYRFLPCKSDNRPKMSQPINIPTEKIANVTPTHVSLIPYDRTKLGRNGISKVNPSRSRKTVIRIRMSDAGRFDAAWLLTGVFMDEKHYIGRDWQS